MFERDRASGRAGVEVMQAADLWDSDHLASGGWLNVPEQRCVAVQGEVRPAVVVIGHVILEDPPQVLISENDQMVEALAPDRPDDSLSIRVLPR